MKTLKLSSFFISLLFSQLIMAKEVRVSVSKCTDPSPTSQSLSWDGSTNLQVDGNPVDINQHYKKTEEGRSFKILLSVRTFEISSLQEERIVATAIISELDQNAPATSSNQVKLAMKLDGEGITISGDCSKPEDKNRPVITLNIEE